MDRKLCERVGHGLKNYQIFGSDLDSFCEISIIMKNFSQLLSPLHLLDDSIILGGSHKLFERQSNASFSSVLIFTPRALRS